MHTLLSIVKLPVVNFPRAVNFYKSVLQREIEEMEMDGNQKGVILVENGNSNVVLTKGNDYIPTREGVILYFNAGDDLQPALNRAQELGAEVVIPKMIISEDMGYYVIFIDTEGNRVGLHSMQ